jgi:hypothetical protein
LAEAIDRVPQNRLSLTNPPDREPWVYAPSFGQVSLRVFKIALNAASGRQIEVKDPITAVDRLAALFDRSFQMSKPSSASARKLRHGS